MFGRRIITNSANSYPIIRRSISRQLKDSLLKISICLGFLLGFLCSFQTLLVRERETLFLRGERWWAFLLGLISRWPSTSSSVTSEKEPSAQDNGQFQSISITLLAPKSGPAPVSSHLLWAAHESWAAHSHSQGERWNYGHSSSASASSRTVFTSFPSPIVEPLQKILIRVSCQQFQCICHIRNQWSSCTSKSSPPSPPSQPTITQLFEPNPSPS